MLMDSGDVMIALRQSLTKGKAAVFLDDLRLDMQFQLRKEIDKQCCEDNTFVTYCKQRKAELIEQLKQ